jgi:tetratricopeptide (TPR) repeat protein
MAALGAGFGYRAFLSYSHQDQSWAQWLHRAIETYRVPSRLVGQPTAAGPIPRRLAPIFRDRDELPSATDLGRKVGEALERSANLIVICSPAAAASRWVDAEVLAFKRLGRADRIFCLVVAGEPNATDLPGRANEECFCPALRFAVDANGALTRERAEPIAADARPHGDGKSNARLKVIAGLIDVGFDALKQREQHRRNRKWALLAAASFAGMLLMGGLSVYALRARSEAIAQRGEAEGLIEFMLGDLRKKLEPVGRLDALDAVGERALKYYSAQDAGALDADSLGRRARALHLIGEVDDLRGNLDHALDVFDAAARSTGELLARSPNNAQRIFDHAQSVYWVGAVAFQRGQNDVAEKSFDAYRALAERLVALEPAKDDWQAEVGYAYSNLGTLMIRTGRAPEAVEAFGHALAVSSALAERAPDDAGRQMDDAQSHAWLADAIEKQMRFDAALAERTAELAIYEKVLASDPQNNSAKRSELVSRHAIARLSIARGELTPAIEQLNTAVKLADGLIAAEPDSTSWADDGAQTHLLLSETLMLDGDDAGARVLAARACATAADLVKRDPTVVRWRSFLLSRCEWLQASLDAKAGQHAAELATVAGVVRRLDDLPSAEKADALARMQLGAALLLRGDEHAALGQHDEAKADWQRAAAELSTDASGEDAAAQTILATALLRAERVGEAAPIVARLEEAGYRHPAFIVLKTDSSSAAHGTRTGFVAESREDARHR